MNQLMLSSLLAVALCGCVSEAAHRAVLSDLDERKAETARLIEQNRILAVELSNRSKELDALRRKFEDLETHRKTEAGDLDLLTQRNLELASEVARLTRENQNLTELLESQTFDLETKIHELENLSRTQGEDLEALRLKLQEFEQAQQTPADLVKPVHDRLVETLTDEIRKADVKIVPLAGRLWLRLSEGLLFDSGRVEIIKPDGREILNRIGTVLKETRGLRIEIQGHTDNVPIGSQLAPRFPTNWELSTVKASTVVRYLVENAGVPPAMLQATGFADTRPIADNATKEGRTANRRIEIVLRTADDSYPVEVKTMDDYSSESEVNR
jgi:chemotaxis protein MotB